MIRIENVITDGWEAAIRGMRNPMNSWDKSDSIQRKIPPVFDIGENDMKLCKRLINAGSDHRKFLRQINISMDITAPFYWWKEFDTYKVGTVANSCSTMHKIHSKPFTLLDFSFDKCIDYEDQVKLMLNIIDNLNMNREKYIETKDKRYWWNMIQILPTSYNQKRTITMNYEVAYRIYNARVNHKLDEWHTFCDIIKQIPYFDRFFLED